MFEILESEDQNKPFKIKGIAMRKNVLSKNGKFYSGKLVESIVNKVSKEIKEKGSYPINMMADHPTFGTNKTLSTVGKITDMYMDGDNAIIEAEIANTSLGKDVQELIRGKFVEGLSIRANKAKFRKKYIDGKMVNDVMEMELQGVDLVTNPGVDGATIIDIIESDQSDSSNLFISIIEEEEIVDKPNLEEEDNQLKLIEAKLSDLKENRPDLVESLKQELKPLFESEFGVKDLQESVDTLKGEKENLQESFDTLKNEKETLESDLAEIKGKLEEAENKLKEIEESEAAAKREAHIATKLGELKFADSVKEKLKAKVEVLESIEEIDSVLESEVEFINSIIKESTGIDLSGKGHTGENGGKHQENEEDEFMKMVMEG